MRHKCDICSKRERSYELFTHYQHKKYLCSNCTRTKLVPEYIVDCPHCDRGICVV